MKKPVQAIKKAVVLAVAIVMTSAGAAFAVTRDVAGGTWDYGTNILNGVAWSSFWHPTRKHGSSVKIGADVHRSACVEADETAKAKSWRPPGTRVSYHYRFC